MTAPGSENPNEPRTDTGEYTPPFVPWTPTGKPAHGWISGWALVAGIIGLASSLFVGWAFPIAIVAIVVAIIALRRPIEPRAPAVWAIVLSTAALVYSAGWLVYAVLVLNSTPAPAG